MEAPDKIYLCADAPRMCDWENKPFEKGGNIEYIRKDVLLEFAKEQLENNVGQYDGDYDFAIYNLIDKLNTM